MIARIAIVQLIALACLRAGDQTEPTLIDLNVVAVDSRGQPVLDLTRNDFQISDAGNASKYRTSPRQRQLAAHTDSGVRRILQPRTSGRRFPHPGPFRLAERAVRHAWINHKPGYSRSGEPRDGQNLYLYMLTLDGRLFAVHPSRPLEQSRGAKQRTVDASDEAFDG